MPSNDNNNENFFGDTDWINEEHTMQLLPPTIQWYRGDLKDKDRRLKLGCWELQAESFEAILGNSQEVIDVVHSGGNVIRAYLFEKIHIAVLAYKKRWYIQDGDRIRFVPYQEGAKSKLQYYCLVRELGGEPAMVSVSGMSAKHLSAASMDFRKRVLQPAMQMARRNFGTHHFWMPLATIGRIDLPKNSQYITPPGLALPEVNQEVIRGLFVGKEVGLLAESLIPQAKAWATQKETPRQADYGSMPEPPPNFYDDEEPDLIPEDEIPF